MSFGIEKAIESGIKGLEKKFMGGVTTESAERAIRRETAQQVQRDMDEVAQKGVEQIKAANEQAMRNMKDAHLRELAAKDR